VDAELLTRLRLGVSACLLGENVRYDGGHKRDPFLVDTLGPSVEWVAVCPELEIGLGVPRDTLRLSGDPQSPSLVVERTGHDVAERMRRFAAARVDELTRLDLDGYVLKRGSPSCGLGVPVYGLDGDADGIAAGLFAAELVSRLPELPIEEEHRLMDRTIRRRFVERVCARARRRRAHDVTAVRHLDGVEAWLHKRLCP
jgi:uncharacterized protein YbbK (DUF523 family)